MRTELHPISLGGVGAAAFAHDEPRGQQEAARGESGINQTFTHGLKSGDGDVATGLLHRGQWHGQQAGNAHIVEANEPDFRGLECAGGSGFAAVARRRGHWCREWRRADGPRQRSERILIRGSPVSTKSRAMAMPWSSMATRAPAMRASTVGAVSGRVT